MFVGNAFFRWVHKLSSVQLIFLFYLLAVIFSTLLLVLPVAHQPDAELSFIDILFTAVSAISVTGLTTISIADTLSTTGVIFLTIIMQLGAVGIMAIGTFIWIILRKKIGLRERSLIMTDQNQSHIAGMVHLVKQIFIVILSIELIGFIILGTYYLQYFPTVGEAYFNGFFSTISATTNGGFDITGNSLHSYNNDYFVQFIHMLLIIFGAIGYPVLIELKDFLFSKPEKRRFIRFTLFTKVTSITFFIFIIVGALAIWVLDIGNDVRCTSWHVVLFASLFLSVTTRSVGLSTLDVSQLSPENHIFMSFLMFIGASPSSAGGGIRTTTFALVV